MKLMDSNVLIKKAQGSDKVQSHFWGGWWGTFGLLLINHYVAPFFFTFGGRSKIAPNFLHLKCAHIPFWLNPTGHSKFHNTLTPSACYRPRSDCLYSLVPASTGGSPSSLPLSFPIVGRHLCPWPACATTAFLNVHVKRSDLTWPDLTWGGYYSWLWSGRGVAYRVGWTQLLIS